MKINALCLIGSLLLLASCGSNETNDNSNNVETNDNSNNVEDLNGKFKLSLRSSDSISISKRNIDNSSLENPQVTAEFITNDHRFYPSTHDYDFDSVTGLKSIANGYVVNFETGTRLNSSTTLQYSSVANSNISDYYRDYDLVIGSNLSSLANKDLVITLDTLKDVKNSLKALSIDFYAEIGAEYSSVDANHFLGTLNCAGFDAPSNNSTVLNPNTITLHNLDLDKFGSGKTLALKLRMYYDGALIEKAIDDNDYAVYTTAGSGTRGENDNILYYSDNQGSSIVNVNVGDSVKGLYIVDLAASTTTFARGIDIMNLSNIELAVSFNI